MTTATPLKGYRVLPWDAYALDGPDLLRVPRPIEHPNYPTYESWPEARKRFGLDWEPVLRPAYNAVDPDYRPTLNLDGHIVANPEGPEDYGLVTGWNWIEHSKTREVFGCAQSTFHPITNDDIGMITEAFRAEGNEVEYVKGGMQRGGRSVWMILRVGKSLWIPGDSSPTNHYIALVASHDGHGSCRVIQSTVRIDCANVFHNADFKKQALHCFSIQHRSNWRLHMDKLIKDVHSALAISAKQSNFYVDTMTELTGMPINSRMESEFVETFIEADKYGTEVRPQTRTMLESRRSTMWGILQGPTCADLPATAYKLLQAAGEYSDYYRTFKFNDRIGERVMDRVMFSADTNKRNALAFARNIANGKSAR